MYSSNAATTQQERDQVEKCARDVLVLHFPVCADWLNDSSKQASNRFSLSTSPLPMCRWAAISEIVSQEWLRTTFLWTRIKSEAVLPRQRQPGCNSGDRAHRDWFRPSYWHPTSQNRRHQKGAWYCSRAFLWLCFLLLLSFLLMWPDFHVIFFHVLWTSFIFSLLLPWGRTEVLWDVCPPANAKKEPGLRHFTAPWLTVTEGGSLWEMGLTRWVEEGRGADYTLQPQLLGNSAKFQVGWLSGAASFLLPC